MIERSIKLVQAAVAIQFVLTIARPALMRSGLLGAAAWRPEVGYALLFIVGAAVPALAAVGVIGVTRAWGPGDRPQSARLLVAVLVFWAARDLFNMWTFVDIVSDGSASAIVSLVSSVLTSRWSYVISCALGIAAAATLGRRLNKRFDRTVVDRKARMILIVLAILIAGVLPLLGLLQGLVGAAITRGESPQQWHLYVVQGGYYGRSVLFLFWDVWLFFELAAISRRIRAVGGCPRCGYPVGASDVCTECGYELQRLRRPG